MSKNADAVNISKKNSEQSFNLFKKQAEEKKERVGFGGWLLLRLVDLHYRAHTGSQATTITTTITDTGATESGAGRTKTTPFGAVPTREDEEGAGEAACKGGGGGFGGHAGCGLPPGLRDQIHFGFPFERQ